MKKVGKHSRSSSSLDTCTQAGLSKNNEQLFVGDGIRVIFISILVFLWIFNLNCEQTLLFEYTNRSYQMGWKRYKQHPIYFAPDPNIYR